MENSSSKSAFTLIEMSIVLVIIGLIIGGILAGQELIAASQMRQQVYQLETYSTAMNTFRLKYDYLPGDMPIAVADQLGLPRENSYDCNPPKCNGNGSYDDLLTGPVYGWLSLEASWAFPQLATAGLVEGHYDHYMRDGSGNVTGNLLPTKVGDYFPATKLNANYGIEPFTPLPSAGWDGNWWVLCIQGGITAFDSWISTYCPGTGSLSPKEANLLDQKIDDGIPSTGSVRAIQWQYGNIPGPQGQDIWPINDIRSNHCVVDASAASYNLAALTPECSLIVKIQ